MESVRPTLKKYVVLSDGLSPKIVHQKWIITPTAFYYPKNNADTLLLRDESPDFETWKSSTIVSIHGHSSKLGRAKRCLTNVANNGSDEGTEFEKEILKNKFFESRAEEVEPANKLEKSSERNRIAGDGLQRSRENDNMIVTDNINNNLGIEIMDIDTSKGNPYCVNNTLETATSGKSIIGDGSNILTEGGIDFETVTWQLDGVNNVSLNADDANFHQNIRAMISEAIKPVLQNQLDMVNFIKEQSDTIRKEIAQSSSRAIDPTTKNGGIDLYESLNLPIKSKKQLKRFDKKLQSDPEFQSTYKNFLKRVSNDPKVSSRVKRIMNCVYDPVIASCYNWYGKKGKGKLERYQSAQLIATGVFNAFDTCSLQDDVIYNIREWLRITSMKEKKKVLPPSAEDELLAEIITTIH